MYILKVESVECSEYSNTPDIGSTIKVTLKYKPTKEQMISIANKYSEATYLGINKTLMQVALYNASFDLDGILIEKSEITRINLLSKQQETNHKRESFIKKYLKKNWKLVEKINIFLRLLNIEICIVCYNIKIASEDNICHDCWEKHYSNIDSSIKRYNL